MLLVVGMAAAIIAGGATNATAGPAPTQTVVTAATDGDYEVAAYCSSSPPPSGWDARGTYPNCIECKWGALSYELDGRFEAYCHALQHGGFRLWTRCIVCRTADAPPQQADAPRQGWRGSAPRT